MMHDGLSQPNLLRLASYVPLPYVVTVQCDCVAVPQSDSKVAYISESPSSLWPLCTP
jgi:hypothetical protein